MKNVLMSFALAVLCTVSVNAQNAKGDWYLGTGDVANTAWTELSIAPTVGYAISDNLMVGCNVSQADSSAEMVLDAHVRYFYNGLFGYVSAPNLDTDNLTIGVGKMFTFHKVMYIDPKVVYDTNLKTTNLMLGFGLKF
jgi:hypothetical protein|tara:strand:+ start:189 stop:602 length:414 start_codon:yes stop_codon:yes gene_type:complete